MKLPRLSRDRLLRLIGLGLFGFVLSRIDLGQTAQRVAHARPEFLVLAGLATAPLFTIRAWRLRVILSGLGIGLPFRQILTLRIVTSAAGDATPGRLGEFSAVAYLTKAGHSATDATLGLLADRILDAGVFALVAVSALSSFGIKIANLGSWLPKSLVPVSAVSYSAIRKRALSDPASTVCVVTGAVALSLASFAVLVFRAYCLALALGIPISYFDLAGVVAISTFVQLLPISVLGIGSRDISLLYLFGRLGLSAGSAISLSWLALAMLILQMAVGLAVWWRYPLRLGERYHRGDERYPVISIQ
ncbi:MAG: hypothetical protein MAG451_03242 [Anaerolineales bacterium]|nr:hypothetical protein [Anaerolineales bacterium]